MSIDESKVQSIFFAALERAQAEQGAFLDRVCGSDATLRRRIDRLLAARLKLGDFLNTNSNSIAAAFVDSASCAITDAVVGPYTLREVLGEGGMGTVYAAEQEKPIRRKVALKVIKPGMDSREVIARFEAERQALALMDHPNISKVLDGGTTLSGRPYFVMELVRGIPITEYCDKCHLDLNARLTLFAQVCRAIQHAHQKGIIHRDLKPSNVLITLHDGKPVPKVIDFGIAKAINQKLTELTIYTRVAQMVGTPMYMSPEQAELSDLDVDTRSDVYSLGVMLYELLTGILPFDTEVFSKANYDELRRMIREDEPLRPSDRISTLKSDARSTASGKRGIDERKFSRTLAGELDWIVMRALEKDRQRRYESASAFAADVQRFLDGEPVAACPPSTIYRLRKFAAKNRATLTMAIVVTASLLVGTAVSLWQTFEATNARHLADERLKDAREHQRVAETYLRQVSESLYAAQMSQAEQALRDGDTRELAKILDSWIPKPGQPDVRGFEYWYLRHRAQLKDHVQLFSAGSAIYSIVHSPHHQMIAAGGKAGIVWLFDELTGEPAGKIETGQIEVNAIAFPSDGQELVTAGDDGTIRIWNLASQQQRLCIQAHPRKAFQALLTRDGSRIIASGNDPDIRVFDSRTGELQYVLRGHQDEVDSLLLDEDGRTLISTSHDWTTRLWDLPSRRQTAVFTSNQRVGPAVISPRPHFFAIGSHSGTMELFRLPDGGELGRVDHLERLKSLAVNRDGTLLASGDSGGGIRLWRLSAGGQLEPGPLAMWHAHHDPVAALEWSTDGKRLLSAGEDGRVVSWNLASALRSRFEVFPIESCNGARLIPQTDLVVCTGSALNTWNWKTGAHVARISEKACEMPSVSSDGRFIAVVSNETTLQLFHRTMTDERGPHYVPAAEWHSEGRLSQLEIAPDKRSIAVCRWVHGNGSAEHEHSVWRLSLPDLQEKEKLPPASVSQLAYGRDSQSILMHPRDEVALWSLLEGRYLWKVPQLDAKLLTFSSDGELAFSRIDDRSVIVRRTSDGQELLRTQAHRKSLCSLAITADGRTLATADFDGVIRLTHIPTKRTLFDSVSGTSHFFFMRFSEDGQNLVCVNSHQIVVFRASDAGRDAATYGSENVTHSR